MPLSEPSRQPGPSRVARLARLALDLGVSPLVYYGCALAGLATLPALLAATGAAAAWLVATAVHTRRADGLAVAMLLMYGLSASLAAVASEPRPLLLRDPLVSALAGTVFLASCTNRPDATPATAYLARRLHGRAAHGPDVLRAHRVQTLVLGAGLTAEALVRVLLVYVLPTPTAAAVTPPLEFAVLGPLVAWMVWYRRRARALAPTRPHPADTGRAPDAGAAQERPAGDAR